jgi:DNA-binding transcriptional MerR regulator
MPEELSIEDLEKHSGLSTRTLHYYMQIGLLPGPEKRGKYASYSQEHLDRLDLILILKEMHLPLKEIRTVLNRLTPSEIVHYRDDQEDLLEKIKGEKPEPGDKIEQKKDSSALDYIKSLEEAHSTHRDIADNRPYVYHNNQTRIKKEPRHLISNELVKYTQQQIWRRMILDDGVELNFLDTPDKERRYKIERLLSFARALFSDNQEEKTDEQ